VRLFVALEIPSAVRENLTKLMKDLRAASSGAKKDNARWVRPENLHVTLKFIGQVDDSKLDAIRGALSQVRSKEHVDLRFQGLGFFPDEKRARVFWAGIEGSGNFSQLAGDVDASLQKLEIPRETRAFAPHLTLARLEPPGASEALRTAIVRNSPSDFGVLRTDEFHLIESKTHPVGAEYTRLSSFVFAPAET
jgi:RNA 2',3'-cyclic 3'-phosphodiesterase